METLTHDFYSNFGNRKKPGRVSIFIDLDQDKIYGVPLGIEHKDYAPTIIGASLEDISKYVRLIPSHIDTVLVEDIPVVNGVITGVSGLEIEAGVRHYHEDLIETHRRAWEFIRNGELEIVCKENITEDKIVTRYAVSARIFKLT